jgi:hypothetical protein
LIITNEHTFICVLPPSRRRAAVHVFSFLGGRENNNNRVMLQTSDNQKLSGIS